MPNITGRHLGTWSYDIAAGRVYVDGVLIDYFRVSKRAQQVGVPREDFAQAIDDEDREYLRAEMKRVMAEGGVLDIFYHVNTRWGARVVRVIGRCYYHDDGRPHLFNGATFDATPSEGALLSTLAADNLDAGAEND